jgi:hypothetical protein
LIEPPLPAVFNQTTPPPRTYRPPPPASPPRKTKTSNTIKQATATGASPPTTSDLERSEIQRLPLKPSETPNDYARRTT